jgi:hypothetical protein
MQRQLARPIVFMHVPKAGGTTVREQLRAWLPNATHVQFTSAQMCDEMSDEELAGTDVLTGHIGFRFLERVPDALTITFLRDPWERAVSQYYYHKYNLGTFKDRPVTFSDYLRSDVSGFRAVLDNGIVWQFAWDQYPCHRDRQRFADDDALLQAALRNIQCVDFIGLQERLDDDLRLLGGFLGVDPATPIQAPANVTSAKPMTGRITEADRAVFERRAALDIRFMAEVRVLLRHRWERNGGIPVRP